MITAAVHPEPPADMPEQVWHMYLLAGKAPELILRGCEAWLGAAAPVQAIAGAS